jgi:hypothetical protein
VCQMSSEKRDSEKLFSRGCDCFERLASSRDGSQGKEYHQQAESIDWCCTFNVRCGGAKRRKVGGNDEST